MFTMILLCFISVSTISISSSTNTVVNTTTGPIKGTFIDSFGVKYYSYQGIPYAEKPTGDLRFKPPVSKSPWTEVLDASHPGFVCPQTEGTYKKEEMNEDCLFLNVFVPDKHTAELLPVLFFVPGGEFKARSSNAYDMYGPQLLLRHNIIIVTLNYRLGALGFLSLDEVEASGNAGLKDILLALQWINANAENFGGDRKKITIGGNSAGSVATQYMLLSTKSVGLFHQAIQISGSALGFRFLSRHAKESALELGHQLGVTSSEPRVLLEKLRQTDAFDIVEAQEALGRNDTRKGFRPFAPFVPCIEIKYPEAIITEEPRSIIKAGIPNNVPILAGFNADEGLKMYLVIKKDNQLVDFFNEDFQLCIPSDIGYPYGSEDSKKLANAIQEFYFKGGSISNDTTQSFVNLITDTMFAHSIDSWIHLHKMREESNVVYFYVFDFDGQLNWSQLSNNINRPGTAHADEIGYLFMTNITKPVLCNLDTRSHRMLDIWTTIVGNFVKYGNPTPPINDIGVIWKESGTERAHLRLDNNPENIDSRPIPKRLKFWQDVYDQYYQYKEAGGEIEYNIFP